MTPMARSSGAPAVAQEGFENAEIRDERTGYRYLVQRRNGGYVLQLENANGSVRAQLNMPFYVGSGTVAQSYLLQQDGFLYQSPVAWYAEKARWDLAPGYKRYDQPFLTRPILPGCLQCHASAVEHRPLTQNSYGSPPFLEGGVACERCHGPGAAHIAGVKSGNKNAALAIVSPSRLHAERRDSICSQCHLTGEVRVTRAGRNWQSFAPGDRLADHVAVFVRSDAAPELKVTSHVENLAQSACKKASGDRLWCGTCHDPHSVPAPAKRAAWYRSKCLSCHRRESCTVAPSARREQGDGCAACHMPRNTVADAEHVVYTDHAIRRRTTRRPEPQAREASLKQFGAMQSDDRDLGLAYAILAGRESSDALRARALTLLQSAGDAGQRDPEALMYLADLLNRNSRREQAVALYEEAIRADPAQLSASVNLGAIRVEQGNYAEAVRLWSDALAKNPALTLVRTNLALALLKTGERARAENVLRDATRYNPVYVPPRALLELLRLR